MAKDLLLGEEGLKTAQETLLNLNGNHAYAIKRLSKSLAQDLRAYIMPTGFYVIGLNAVHNLWRSGEAGPTGSLSCALLEHSIPDIAMLSCPEEFAKRVWSHESDPKYSVGDWKGYVCFNDSGINALRNVATRSYEIATVRGLQESHYETLEDFRADFDKCKKLGFEDSVIGQLEILAAKVASERFPISFVRAQDPRVQAVITAYTPRRFIPLEELANQ